MKAEHILDTLGTIDEALLAESLPKRRRGLRRVMVAAAVAAVLTIGVGAACLTAPELFYPTAEQAAVRSRFGGTDFAPETVERLLEADRSLRRGDIEGSILAFDTLEELQTWLGVGLLRSSQREEQGCFLQASGAYTEVCEEGLGVYVHQQPRGSTFETVPFALSARLAVREDAVGTLYSEAPEQGGSGFWYEIENLGVTALVVEGLYRPRDVVAFFVMDGIAYEAECRASAEALCAFLETLSY